LLSRKECGGIDFILHTNLFTGKTGDLTLHPRETNMSFLDPVSGSWASVSGAATIHSDRDTIAKYYTPELKVWLGDLGDGVHNGGPSDPRIGIIRLESKFVTYTIAKKGLIGRTVDIVKGAAKGEAPSINRMRELSEKELNECQDNPLNSFFLFFFSSSSLDNNVFADLWYRAPHSQRINGYQH
jgi:general stress protein 26